MATDRAKKYADLLRFAAQVPIDIDEKVELKLPEYADQEKIKRGQKIIERNFFVALYGQYLGVITIAAIPTLLNVLIHTGKSSSSEKAYRRLMGTVMHTLEWFRGDLIPGSRAWKSILAVRKMHLRSNKSAKLSNVGIISQKDAAITIFGFMGYVMLLKDKIGFYATDDEIEDVLHFYRVLGYLSGIKDEYNICCDTPEETFERLEVIRTEFLRPDLENASEDFRRMTRYMANGVWCLVPRDSHDVLLFSIKRFCGVPNYYYTEDEIPKGYDRSKLEIYKLGIIQRILYYFINFTHEYLLKFMIIRQAYNILVKVQLILMNYFPILAIYRFGWNRAWVSITKVLEKKIKHIKL